MGLAEGMARDAALRTLIHLLPPFALLRLQGEIKAYQEDGADGVGHFSGATMNEEKGGTGGCKKDCVNGVLKQNEGERDETGPKQL